MAWVESNCPRDCGIVCWGDAECDDNSQRPPKPSHNHLGSYSQPRLSLFSKVGYIILYDFTPLIWPLMLNLENQNTFDISISLTLSFTNQTADFYFTK